jgi:hypothetical protein
MNNNNISMSIVSLKGLCYDIIRHIVTYMDDVDIRRKYNVYEKINLNSNYQNLYIWGFQKIEPIPMDEFLYVPINNTYYRSDIKNMYEFDERREQNIRNDFMTICECKNPENNVDFSHLDITIYRFRPNHYLNIIDDNNPEEIIGRKREKRAGYSCGTLQDYFWEYNYWSTQVL